jgi:hypothetical protein
MQIRVEIEVKPEELRRFLGLPDVAGLQDELVNFVKEKMGQAAEGLNPAADFVRGTVEKASESLNPAADFVRENFGSLKDSGTATINKLLSSVKLRISEPEAPSEPPAAASSPRKRRTKADQDQASAGKSRRRRTPKA